MKKVLLSSVAALAVFSAAAPAFAQGENPNSSNQLIQKKYVSERDIADEVNTQVAAHEAEINEEAERQPAVVAAKAALEAYGSGHLYGEYVAKVEAARTEARNIVRNRYVQVIQEKVREAAKAQGNYWNDPTGIEDNKPNDVRKAEDQIIRTGKGSGKGSAKPTDGKGSATPEPGKPGVVDQAKKADDAAKKAGVASKAGQKALPKTHAAK
jgi:amylase-binding protein abpA